MAEHRPTLNPPVYPYGRDGSRGHCQPRHEARVFDGSQNHKPPTQYRGPPSQRDATFRSTRRGGQDGTARQAIQFCAQ